MNYTCRNELRSFRLLRISGDGLFEFDDGVGFLAKALGATPPFIGRRDPSLTNARAMVAFITEVTQ